MAQIVKLSVCCKICGELTLIEKVDLDGYNSWHAGTVIQKALPELSDDDRELMISNICSKCWEGMFADADEEDSLENQNLVERMPDYERKTGKKLKDENTKV